MALIKITGDCDLLKVKKGEECLAYVCAHCQYSSFGGFNRVGTNFEHSGICQCCGHIDYGVVCVCVLGDWLSLNPIRVHHENNGETS